MTKLFNLEKLKNKLPLHGHGALVMLLPVVFFFAAAATGQLPVTQAQEEGVGWESRNPFDGGFYAAVGSGLDGSKIITSTDGVRKDSSDFGYDWGP